MGLKTYLGTGFLCILALVAADVAHAQNASFGSSTAALRGTHAGTMITLSEPPKPRKDKIDSLERIMRWSQRGALAFDLSATTVALSTPNLYAHGGCFAAPGQLINAGNGIQAPGEGNIWKYFGGSRNRPGVAISAATANIAADFLLEKAYKKLSGRTDKWRRLRVLIPIIHGLQIANHVDGGVGQLKSRAEYFHHLDHLSLPHNSTPTPAPCS